MTDHTYIVPMFPYPSGKLHMGHVRNYSISDAIALHYRRQGRAVIHPIGWDAFGLPAENAAREHGCDPRQWTDANIQSMQRQLQDMGFSFDKTHELATHTPSYILAGQTLFLQFYQHGLIERRFGDVSWDPVDETVLANEQVIEGRGWRSGALVETRTLSMLFARVSQDAKELSDDLNEVNWPATAISLQKAWIGADETPPRLRDWCLSRQRSWGTPVPLIQCDDCGEVPAAASMLPMLNLPTKPTAADLAFPCPACGKPAVRSHETLDTFWDSAFYTYCYPDARDGSVQAIAGDAFQRTGGVDLYVGGIEHATMHLMYARWFARAMQKVGYNVDQEPFKRLIGQGMVCAPAYRVFDGKNPGEWVNPELVSTQENGDFVYEGKTVRYMGALKMSKSKKNGVDPSRFIQRYGSETVRFAMLFAAPYSVEIDWNDDIVKIAKSNIDRIISQSLVIASADGGSKEAVVLEQVNELRHKMMASYEGTEGLNAMMGMAMGVWKSAYRAAQKGNGDDARVAALCALDALWPIAPRAMEEAGRNIDPTWTARPVSMPETTHRSRPIVVQVNGIKRGLMHGMINSEQEALTRIEKEFSETLKIHAPNGYKDVIWVPGRVINLVSRET